jgi:hypothetical protein
LKLDDIDIEYSIYEYISTSNSYKSYLFGYKISLRKKLDTKEKEVVDKIMNYFKKYYIVDMKTYNFTILEKISIIDNDDLLLSNLHINKEHFYNIKKFF